MSNRELIRQCLVTLAMVIIMGVALVSTYDGPEHLANNSTDVIGGAPVVNGHMADNEYEGIIRLHVVANSNSDADQAVKLKVRDAVISQVNDLNEKGDIEMTRQWLESHLDDLTETANDVIAENDCNYRATVELGVRWIPEKTYDDMYFPAGNYEALTITLGKGEGENWWCVLFPPLCLITEDEAELEEMGIDSQDHIKVKSWLREVLGE